MNLFGHFSRIRFILPALLIVLAACQSPLSSDSVQAAPVEAAPVEAAQVEVSSPHVVAAAPSEEATVQQEEAPTLATASAVSILSNQPGRAIVTARGNHFVVDSVPPLDGPNEEVNPLDAILGALATCGTFVYESAAQEMEIPANSISTTVQGDFNAAGVKDGSVDPRIQALRVHMTVDGPSDEQLAALAKQFQARCPIYTTLIRAADIEITHNDEAMSEAAEGLATATVVSTLTNQPGRAIVTARGNHFVIDSCL